MFRKDMKIGQGEKYDVSSTSTEGITLEEKNAMIMKNMKLKDVFTYFNTDAHADSQLSQIELAKAMDAFDVADTNKDGKLSSKELDAMAKKMTQDINDYYASIGSNEVVNLKGGDLKNFLKGVHNATKNDAKESTAGIILNEARTTDSKSNGYTQVEGNNLVYQKDGKYYLQDIEDGKFVYKRAQKFEGENGTANWGVMGESQLQAEADAEKQAGINTKAKEDGFTVGENGVYTKDNQNYIYDEKSQTFVRAKQHGDNYVAMTAEELSAEQADVAEKARKEQLATPTDYTVQRGDNFRTLIKQSLESQGIEANDEAMNNAIEEFKRNNPGKLHGRAGEEYLFAGDVVKISGGLEDKAIGDEIKNSAPVKDKAPAENKAPSQNNVPSDSSSSKRGNESVVNEASKKSKSSSSKKDDSPVQSQKPQNINSNPKSNTPVNNNQNNSRTNHSPNASNVNVSRWEQEAAQWDDLLSKSQPENGSQNDLGLLKEIAKGDNPILCAKALAAAANGVGTNEPLVDAALKSIKNVEYLKLVNQALSREGYANIKQFVGSEYFSESSLTVSPTVKEYLDNYSKDSAKYYVKDPDRTIPRKQATDTSKVKQKSVKATSLRITKESGGKIQQQAILASDGSILGYYNYSFDRSTGLVTSRTQVDVQNNKIGETKYKYNYGKLQSENTYANGKLTNSKTYYHNTNGTLKGYKNVPYPSCKATYHTPDGKQVTERQMHDAAKTPKKITVQGADANGKYKNKTFYAKKGIGLCKYDASVKGYLPYTGEHAGVYYKDGIKLQ